jgi:hypothetical protein
VIVRRKANEPRMRFAMGVLRCAGLACHQDLRIM